MKKSKIAISIEEEILDLVDNYIEDSSILGSRSHAIEYLIRKAINQEPVSTAVLLMREKDQHFLFERFSDKTLMEHHLEFLAQNKIKKVFLVTKLNEKVKQVNKIQTNIELVLFDEEEAKGTAHALHILRKQLRGNFIVINADTFNDFNIQKMIKHHIEKTSIATLGLISSNDPKQRGSVILDGSQIVSFKQKDPTATSTIINAGIYILNSKIFDLISDETKSLEVEIFPKLASDKKIHGYFTFGQFVHMPDKMMEMPLAEVIDRYTIAKLKSERIGEPHTFEEVKALQEAIKNYKDKGFEVKNEWLSELYRINGEGWDIESDIRQGKEDLLGLEEVGRRAIKMRENNKRRVTIKNQIADLTGSGFKDVKMNHVSAD
jgi:NDP-sugar pyrophosphorylase family protein